jgi:hypothetical protein
VKTKLLAAAPVVLAAFVVLGPAVTASAGGFENGNFACSVSGSTCASPFTTLYAGDSSSIAPWKVTQNSVDWINTYWSQPSSTSYSIDMNGTANSKYTSANGQIAQTFPTTAGATYDVKFELSGNFNSACKLPGSGPTPVQTVWVDAPAAPIDTTGLGTAYTFPEPASWSYSTMGWTPETYSFTAAQGSTSSTLTFTADPSNTTDCGPAIGDVTVTESPTSTVTCSGSCQSEALSPSTGVNGGVNTNTNVPSYSLTAAFGTGTLNCDSLVSHGGTVDPLAVTATSTVGGSVTLTFPPSFFSNRDQDADNTPVCFGADQRFPTWRPVEGSTSFPYQGLLYTCDNHVYRFVTRHFDFPLTACISSYSWSAGSETVVIQTSSFGTGGGDPMYW